MSKRVTRKRKTFTGDVNKSYFYYRISKHSYWPQLIESLNHQKFTPEPVLTEKNGIFVISAEKKLPPNIISTNGNVVFSCPEIPTWNSARGNIKKQKINPLNFPLIECVNLINNGDEDTVTGSDYEKFKYSSYLTQLVRALNDVGSKTLYDFVSNKNVYITQFKLLISILNATQQLDVDDKLVQLDILMKILHQNEYVIPLLPNAKFDNLCFTLDNLILSKCNKTVKFCDVFELSFKSNSSLFDTILTSFNKYLRECTVDTAAVKQLLSSRVLDTPIKIEFIDDIEYIIIKTHDFKYMCGNDLMIVSASHFKCIIWFSCGFFSQHITIIIEKMILF
jgi:hypothetical protein